MIFSPAFDFSTRSSTADSHPVKIDSTPPEKSDRPIKIEGRHLSNLSEINAWYVWIVNTMCILYRWYRYTYIFQTKREHCIAASFYGMNKC